jgi:ribosomal protein S4
MAIYFGSKQDICRYYKEDFWGELRNRKNVYANINKFVFGRKKRKYDNSTRFDVIKLDNKKYKRRKRLTKKQIRFLQKEKIKHYFLNLSEHSLRSMLLRTRTIKVSKGQNFKDRNVHDAFTTRLDHLVFTFGWAMSLGQARVLIKKGAIQVNRFIPSRIDFIPMVGDEIQVRNPYKRLVKRNLIRSRQRRLKTDFKLSQRRLAYYLNTVRDREWKKLRPRLFYKKFKLFRNPAVRKADFARTNRFHRFYKKNLTRHSVLSNWFHPKNFNKMKKRVRYPFRNHTKSYKDFYKGKLDEVRDHELHREEQLDRLKFIFGWLVKLKHDPKRLPEFKDQVNTIKRFDRTNLEIQANPYSKGTPGPQFSKFFKDNSSKSNRDRLHSRHAPSYYRDRRSFDAKLGHFKKKWPKRKKFDKFESDQTVFESDLFLANRTLYFKVMNGEIDRAHFQKMDREKWLAMKSVRQRSDSAVAPIATLLNRGPKKVEFKDDDFVVSEPLPANDPLYWKELHEKLQSYVPRYNWVFKIDNVEKASIAELDRHARLSYNKFIKLVCNDSNIELPVKPLVGSDLEIVLDKFVDRIRYQKFGLNRVTTLLNCKKKPYSNAYSSVYGFGPTNINKLYQFTCDIIKWPIFASDSFYKRLRQFVYDSSNPSSFDSYNLVKGVIEHYYAYCSFFYAKRNSLTLKKKGALHLFLRFLRRVSSPKLTDLGRKTLFKYPDLMRGVMPHKQNSHYLSIPEVRVLSRDRVRPAIVSDYTIPLLIARAKTIRGLLNPQFEVLARNILSLNKLLIKTFIRNSKHILPSRWLKLKNTNKQKKITARFLTSLIVRLSTKLGIPVFNRPIYNLKLGIRGRAKLLLDKQANLIENTKFPLYSRFYFANTSKKFEKKLKKLKKKALRIRYKTLIARRFPNFIMSYKLLLAIYLGPKRISTVRRLRKRTRTAGKKYSFKSRRRNRLFGTNRRQKNRLFHYFPFKFNLRTILAYYGNGKHMEKLNKESQLYITPPRLPHNTRF